MMMKKLNKEGPAVLNGLPQPAQLDSETLQDVLRRGGKVIDARPAIDFATAHIPGTINIPADNAFTNWAGWLLDYDHPFYLIADTDTTHQLTRDLIYIGLDNIAGHFDPSVVEAWPQKQGYTVTTPDAVAEQVANGTVTVVDVRGLGEWEEGHIPQAQHIMLGYLAERAQELLTDKPVVVQCRSGARSAIGASILQARGIRQVINLEGGYQRWAESGLPIAR